MSKNHSEHGNIKNYIIGFTLSLILTITAFVIVWQTLLEDIMLISVLIILAITQLYVQIRYFFGLEQEGKPRWNTMAFLFMLMVVVIVVIGSLWIMANLNYNMMPEEVESYIIEEEAINP
jgi:cytochrome o ubiquinol oxidase operon protein cyoD